MERQADYIVQVTKYLFEKNKGSFRYAVMPREEIVKSWTLSLREGQLKHPATGPTCQSYYKVSVIFFSRTVYAKGSIVKIGHRVFLSIQLLEVQETH